MEDKHNQPAPPPRKSNHSKGFTLAEILITLTIIGVVAVLTIPTLLQKYQEQVTVSKVKKFYSTVSNALELEIKDNGTLDNWNIKNVADLTQPIIKHLKVQKDCGNITNSGCIPTETYRLDNGNLHANYETATFMGGYYKLILDDGSCMWVRLHSTQICENGLCGNIWYDTNGKKAPNTFGKDVFTFRIRKDSLVPSSEALEESPEIGAAYTQHIILNGNMDYLHK